MSIYGEEGIKRHTMPPKPLFRRNIGGPPCRMMTELRIDLDLGDIISLNFLLIFVFS